MKKKCILLFEKFLFLVIICLFFYEKAKKKSTLYVYHMINQIDIKNKNALTLNCFNICLFSIMIAYTYHFLKIPFLSIVLLLCTSKKDKTDSFVRKRNARLLF